MLKTPMIAAACLLASFAMTVSASECSATTGGLDMPVGNCVTAEAHELTLNRVYHNRLITESAFYRQLLRKDSQTNVLLESYRLYLTLAEEFARVLSPDTRERARILNTVYEQQIEITESRIRGRDNIADRLERKN